MTATGARPAIRIIVPVFRDLDATRACLESLASSDLPTHASVLVIDDGSPEPALSEFCLAHCRERGWDHMVNPANIGFVATANRGFNDCDADVILLNSDTRVYGDWVQRLARCAYADDSTGTVTPFSNDATICSYPVFQASNELPPGWTATAMDDLFSRANRGLRQEIPTAVGFCMYIRRACLDAVGNFDEENFGRGYGEECDFSMRAMKQGWSNQLAADVFVYHEGSASFQDESGELKTSADQTMIELHPGWEELIDNFLADDPLAPLRSNVDTLRLAERPSDIDTVLAEHAHYARTILARFSLVEQARRDSRKEIAALLRERDELGQLLGECREQFTAADDALRHADDVVGGLRGDLAQQQRELERQQQELGAAANRIGELEARIALMENSRSWRYTAWLRRGDEQG